MTIKPPINIQFIKNGCIVQGYNTDVIVPTAQGNQPEQIAIYCADYDGVCATIKAFWPTEGLQFPARQ